VVIRGGKMTQAGSSWGEKVITPNLFYRAKKIRRN